MSLLQWLTRTLRGLTGGEGAAEPTVAMRVGALPKAPARHTICGVAAGDGQLFGFLDSVGGVISRHRDAIDAAVGGAPFDVVWYLGTDRGDIYLRGAGGLLRVAIDEPLLASRLDFRFGQLRKAAESKDRRRELNARAQRRRSTGQRPVPAAVRREFPPERSADRAPTPEPRPAPARVEVAEQTTSFEDVDFATIAFSATELTEEAASSIDDEMLSTVAFRLEDVTAAPAEDPRVLRVAGDLVASATQRQIAEHFRLDDEQARHLMLNLVSQHQKLASGVSTLVELPGSVELLFTRVGEGYLVEI